MLRDTVVCSLWGAKSATACCESQEFYGHQDDPTRPAGGESERDLNECADSGQRGGELPDHRLIAIAAVNSPRRIPG